MNSHTAGEWKMAQESIDPEWHIITAPGGRIIANVHIEDGNAMDKANATLLMAAADLKEALHAALFFVPIGTKAREAADAAIAKATTI